MNKTQHIYLEDYNYHLPEDRIAKFPLPQRDRSKLLVCKDNQLQESVFSSLENFLPESSLLIFNNTKVIRARMIFQKSTGAQVEIFCLEPKIPADYAQAFVQNKECTWLCMIGNLKRWKEGLLQVSITDFKLYAERLESYGDTHTVRFFWDNPCISFAEILDCYGELPIPPYLNRKTEESDKKNYQTVYSKIKGSVAAPTAGLHFTEAVFESFKKKQIRIEELTLHVGAGTFKPIKTEAIAEHVMHAECISIKRTTVEQLLNKKGKVIAVGTTSVRSLESLYYIGEILENYPDAGLEDLEITQWMPYSFDFNQLSVEKSLMNVLDYFDRKQLDVLTTRTQIMILPAYTFRIVDGIITNFHQPKSTLLLLISAFLDGKWKEVYDYALDHDFRFLSYGDSSLLLKCNN